MLLVVVGMCGDGGGSCGGSGDGAPLGRVGLRVTMSVCLSVCLFVCLRHQVQFFPRPVLVGAIRIAHTASRN